MPLNQADEPGIVVSTHNTTNTPLGAGGTFIGIADNISSFVEITINLAGAPSVAPVEAYFEFSPDGVNWDISVLISGAALTGPSLVPQYLRVVLPYFRMRLINGATPLTELRLTTVFHRKSAIRLTRFLHQELNKTEGIEIARAVLTAELPDGLFYNLDANDSAPDPGATGLVTRPIVAALPLPAGASTEATLAQVKTDVDRLDVALSTRATAATQTDGSQKTQVTNFPGSQAVTGPLTDAQLRAAPVPVTATFDTSALATEATLAAIKAKTDNLDVALSTRAVTGLTDTQLRASAVPVSAAALPLPVGAATEVTSAAIKAKTDNIDVLLSTRTKPSDQQHAIVDSSTLPTGAATETTLVGIKTGTDKIPVSPAQEHVTAGSPSAARLSDGAAFYKATTPTDTQPVSAAALPLPTGASTEATLALIKAKTDNLDVALSTRAVTGLTDTQLRASAVPISGTVTANLGTTAGLVTDANLDEKFGDLGQKASAGSAPVVIASDQSAVPISAVSLPLPAGAAKESGGNLDTLVAHSPLSAFSLPLFAEITAITRQHFTYGIQPHTTKTFASSGSSLVGSGNAGSGADLIASINNANNAFAIARSFKALHYYPGMGQIFKGTAAFNAGVASSQQFAGLWSPGAGLWVGFNGATWGCTARIGGTQEVRTLTVTTAATSANNATVTVDGTAVVVALTNQTGNPSRTAWEISQADFSAAGGAGSWGWDAYALGAIVYFIARRARVNGGTFSYTVGATGSAAAFASVRAGIAENDVFGSPATPNGWTFFDALDGTGPSGLNLDKTKGIIYVISAGHLGHRGARMSVVHPVNETLLKFAEYRYMNTSINSVLTNPTLYPGWGIISNGSTTAMSLQAGSALGGVEGKVDLGVEGEPWSVSSSKNATSGVAVHFLSVRNGPVAGFSGQLVRVSRTELFVEAVEITASNAASSTSIAIQVLRGATLTNLANFTQVNATRLALWAWQDTTTTTVTVSGGDSVEASVINSTSGTFIVPLNLSLEPGEMLSVVVTGSASSILTNVTLRGRERQ